MHEIMLNPFPVSDYRLNNVHTVEYNVKLSATEIRYIQSSIILMQTKV